MLQKEAARLVDSENVGGDQRSVHPDIMLCHKFMATIYCLEALSPHLEVSGIITITLLLNTTR